MTIMSKIGIIATTVIILTAFVMVGNLLIL